MFLYHIFNIKFLAIYIEIFIIFKKLLIKIKIFYIDLNLSQLFTIITYLFFIYIFLKNKIYSKKFILF